MTELLDYSSHNQEYEALSSSSGTLNAELLKETKVDDLHVCSE